MERSFAAQPAVVFAFVTQMQNLLQWWGPVGTTITDHNLDFSRPGPWSATMVGPQGHGATVAGQVIAIDPPNFVELTLSFRGDDHESGPESVIRFDLSDGETGGTRLLLTQSGLRPEHIADMRDKGWDSALNRLAKLLMQPEEMEEI